VTDHTGDGMTQTFELIVNPRPVVSQPPVITSKPSGPAYVGETWSYNVEAFDPENDTLTYWLINEDGQATQLDSTIIAWTPNEVGEKSFTIRIEDANGSWTEQSFNVAAVEVPVQSDVPKITSVPLTPAFVGERYEYQVTAITYDGSSPTFSVDQASENLGISIDATGLLTWSPESATNVTITVFVNDASGNVVSQTFVLTSVERPVVLDPPTITSRPTGPAYINEAWNYTLSATSADGNAVTFYLVSQDGTTTEIPDGNLHLTWDTAGAKPLIIRAVNLDGAWVEQHFTIQVFEPVVITNEPPVIRSVPTEQIRLNDTYQYRIVATDPNDDTLKYRLANAPKNASLSHDGLLAWYPSVTGQYEFTIAVSDGEYETLQSFTLNVLPPVTLNTPPQITSIITSGAMKDRLYQYQATATDTDGDVITWSLDTSDIPESARGDISIDSVTGLFTWTPLVSGSFTFKIIASDGKDSNIQKITLPVSDNAPPEITALPNPNGEVGSEYISKVEATDPNGDAIAYYKLENAPVDMSISDDGTITWKTPLVGRYVITVIVSDGKLTAQLPFELRITDPNAINHAPQLDTLLPSTIPVNRPFTAQLNATDEDSDIVTFKLIDAPAGLTLSSNGRIEWTPQSLGNATIKFEISDGKVSGRYEFTFEVVAQRENNPPKFVSTPPESVTVDKQFTYKPVVIDQENDAVSISLVSAPAEMTINQNGEIVWTPNSSLLGQKAEVIIRATDIYGKSVDQKFQLAVRSVIIAPKVNMEKPLPAGFVGQPMTYQIEATDPQGEKLEYILEGLQNISTETPISHWGDANVDAKTGLLSYTPSAEFADNIIGFRIRVVNESGVSTPVIVFPMMVYNPTNVDPNNPDNPVQTYNNLPRLQLPNSHYIEAGKPYEIQITATDKDTSDTLTFTLTIAPDNMTIDKNTGIINWEPDASYVGKQVEVGISVSDNRGASSSGYFYLGITEQNTPPEIKDIASQTVTAGTKFQYYVSAKDNEYDTLTYSLNPEAVALGITINAATGLITWNTNVNHLQSSPHKVWVYVDDGRGGKGEKELYIYVVEDKIAPTVNILVNPSKTAAGNKVTITVTAADNVGVAVTTLKLHSITKIIDKVEYIEIIDKEIQLINGRAEYTLAQNEYGILTFEATAKDANNNAGTAIATVQATNPADTESPTTKILSLQDGAKIYGPIDIIGTVDDNEPGSMSWTLKAYSADGSNKEVVITEKGFGKVTNGVLGRFDTTMLRNGKWRIVLEATDGGGQTSKSEVLVELEGDYKLGNFNRTFTDFDLQLGGLPITITRTYDTLNADVKGDFGYGWTLDIATTEISIVIGDGGSAQKGFSPYTPISDGTHITITLPDGTKEGFTFQAKGGGYGTGSMFEGMLKSQYYKPAWIPDVGTKSTLQADDTWLYAWGDGTYYVMDSYDLNQSDYSPANVNGGFLTLTLRNGVDLVIDATNGKLHQAIDTSNNVLTFTDRGITHSSGKGVTFDRDGQDRISAITGPDGKRVEYKYDTLGNLIAVTDQHGDTVQFTYLTDENAPQHYLDKVIDPLGRTAAKTEFDEQGRIKKVIDADGKTIEYDFNTEARIQKVTDQLGNTTIIENDERGNVIREVSPEGAVTLRTYDTKGNIESETQVVIHNGVEIKLTTTYTYDADGNKETEKDARGNITAYTYNKYGQLTSTTSGGVTTVTNYDANTGLPTITTDVNSNTTSYKFDERGNMTSLVNSNGVQLITSTYNKYGEVTSITSTNGRTTYMKYDNNGDCIETYYYENGIKILDETIYDEARRVTERRHYVGTELIWKTETKYNAAGQVVLEIDQNKLKTQYTYDVRGLQTEVRSESKGSDGKIVIYIQRTVYDAVGHATYSSSYIEGTEDEKIYGSHTEYDRDGRNTRNEQLLGLVIKINENGNSFVENSGTILASSFTVYNNAGWVISSTDSYGLVTEYVYNVFGETTKTRRELPNNGGWMVSETVYDSQGRVVFSTDSHLEGSTDTVYGTETKYDDKGRSTGSIRYKDSLVAVSETTGESTLVQRGSEVYHTSTAYDTKGRVQSSTDAYGNITTYEYDNLDRQIKVKQSNGLITETVYNNKGQVEKSIIRFGSEERVTSYKYDEFGNIIETTQPDGTKISAKYNEKGQKESETNQLGQTRHFEYDDNGRLIKVTLPQVNGESPVYEYTYDAQGNQLTIKDPNCHITSFTYDLNGNQLTRILPDGSEESFEYNEKGQLEKETSFEGVVTVYQYDKYGRLESKTFTQNRASEVWEY
ncbi:MAG: hypothetical protein LBU65_01585, partial [Planctomycetaceae bacterium]|nr:hypothetical protein [Planctomycetaceae bacterium]